FYLLGEEDDEYKGKWIASTSTTKVAPMRAFLVQAKAGEVYPETHTITIKNNVPAVGKGTNYANDNIMFVVKNAEYSDEAYVLFKKGHGLNKIEHRNAEIPMLYVISEGENYAIADMPDNTDVINLGFEAKTMGQYTISFKAEGQYSYMHLVDKLTGNDIDMLVEDSYTFVGTPNDRNDRFVLRLNYNAAGIDTESDIFAYQSGNDIMVSGEGELQVFDIVGRKVMTTDINGVETINGMNRGVYIFRLNEKTQKIVVR
ncbi:MAG: T9SS type A sorting domain-containing protein, partial [Bacteroidales bacterium]|nr:T9SS type A sorting domain-containing protein [Bacteroidales bacterium]